MTGTAFRCHAGRRLRRLRLFGPTVIYHCARATRARAHKGKRRRH